ncbi:MAG: M23 family metallopeptidase [Mediterranea sp.]|jgi:lipoprotein NlpD|nr:M23 family metallopeptidase [Mediterranea sp.]
MGNRRRLFWKNFKFKYKITIINENTLEEVAGLRVSKMNGLSVLLTLLAVLFLVAACIIAFTPLRNYLPGYMNSEVRMQIVKNDLTVDSLREVMNRQHLYIMNIQDIFSGKVRIDSVRTLDSLTTARADTLMERTRREEEFRHQYEEREKYNLTSISSQPDINGLLLYRPTRGLVVTKFDEERQRYGTDIAASPNESVLATMDGTVVVSTYTADTGYLIAVQHNQDLLSLYKYCGPLLKNVGDRVKGGEAIAVVASGTAEGNAPHLHFELWFKGHPVNSEKYIVY